MIQELGRPRDSNNSVGQVIDTDYYLQIQRTSITDYSVKWGTATDYSGNVANYTNGSGTDDLDASITGLRYIKICNGETESYTNATGYITELKFWDSDDPDEPPKKSFTFAYTDDKTTVTDVPAGSQFEETDTRKFYQMKDTSDAYTNVDDLKVYFQWENTSGNITNLAEDKGSSSSLGTGADVVSGTFTDYEQTGIIEKCVGFDGYDDYGALGTSLSQFNFFHGTGDWTVNFWIRLSSYVNEARYFDNLSGTEESGITLRNGGSTTTLGIAVCNDSNGDFMANADFSLDEALSNG